MSVTNHYFLNSIYLTINDLLIRHLTCRLDISCEGVTRRKKGYVNKMAAVVVLCPPL